MLRLPFCLGSWKWEQMSVDMGAISWPKENTAGNIKNGKTKTLIDPGSLKTLLKHWTTTEAANQTYYYIK